MEKKLSHINDGNPEMVDVGAKTAALRKATALAIVRFPDDVWAILAHDGFTTPKGPLLQTANLAGVMAAKQTSSLIPLCHPLALEKVSIRFEQAAPDLHIFCEARITSKTGVEMEALTGVSIAALTVYDMCKALSHDIQITSIRLESKQGGKNDFVRGA